VVVQQLKRTSPIPETVQLRRNESEQNQTLQKSTFPNEAAVSFLQAHVFSSFIVQ